MASPNDEPGGKPIEAVKRLLKARLPIRAVFLYRYLSPERRRLTIGLLIATGAAWMFAVISEDLITYDALIRFDEGLSDWLRTSDHHPMEGMMLSATSLGSITAIIGVTFVTCLFFLITRSWFWLITTLVALPGGMLMNYLLKNLFSRARPGWADPSAALSGFSFPSGHTMMATVMYGLIAAFWWRQAKSYLSRSLAVFTAASIALSVAISRVYLGAHYLSDVLSALAAGLFWLSVCLIAIFSGPPEYISLILCTTASLANNCDYVP